MTDTSMDAFAELRTKAVDAEVLPPAGIGDNSEALVHVDRLAELARQINGHYENIATVSRKNSDEMVEIGERLLEAKELVKHGKFKKWIETNLRLPYSTAASWMAVSKNNKKDELSRWLIEDLSNAPWTREILTPNDIISTIDIEDLIDDLEDDLDQSQTGEEIQARVIAPTEVPPQTKRTETKVLRKASLEMKMPEAVKALPTGVPERRVGAQVDAARLETHVRDHCCQARYPAARGGEGPQSPRVAPSEAWPPSTTAPARRREAPRPGGMGPSPDRGAGEQRGDTALKTQLRHLLMFAPPVGQCATSTSMT